MSKITVEQLNADEIAHHIGEIARSYGAKDQDIPTEIKIELTQLIILNGILHQMEKMNNNPVFVNTNPTSYIPTIPIKVKLDG